MKLSLLISAAALLTSTVSYAGDYDASIRCVDKLNKFDRTLHLPKDNGRFQIGPWQVEINLAERETGLVLVQLGAFKDRHDYEGPKYMASGSKDGEVVLDISTVSGGNTTLGLSCAPLPNKCQDVPEGESVSGYLTPTSPCVPVTVTCVDGNLTGPMPFESCTEN